jgi:hypothetical protein
MHAAVRIYQLDPGQVEEFKQRVNEGFLPIIEGAPGFRAYYALDAGGGRIASVSVFDDRAGAEESTRMASENIRKKHGFVGPEPRRRSWKGRSTRTRRPRRDRWAG